MKKTIPAIIAIFFALCSCKSTDLTYFSDIKESQSGTMKSIDYQIRLEPTDELLITVTSEVPEATLIYNLPVTNPAFKSEMTIGNTQSQQQTYIVDTAGNINFPVLGKIHVKGMTTAELTEELTRKIAETVESPYVRVELVNFKVKVLGEVENPGVVEVNKEKFSILDALAAAGDMTVYGRRENVLIVREENGQNSYIRLNLNDSKTLESPYFYLKQNDAVYVEPSSSRSGQADYNQNNSYKVSVVSAIVSGISVITSLVIALAVK